jgi:hypothetical protein
METDDDNFAEMFEHDRSLPRHRVQTLDELWALIKFRLIAQGSVERIDAEIDRMVCTWIEHVNPSPESAEDFRSRLFKAAREALVEDDEARQRRPH